MDGQHLRPPPLREVPLQLVDGAIGRVLGAPAGLLQGPGLRRTRHLAELAEELERAAIALLRELRHLAEQPGLVLRARLLELGDELLEALGELVNRLRFGFLLRR